VYRGVRGNPVLFDDTMRRHLVALRGDSGARDLLDAMGDRVAWVAVDLDAPRDVDTPDDLRALDD
jgi:CTP:molybdopterin cytidylyltransferase MocA